jgi:hypothetical protein
MWSMLNTTGILWWHSAHLKSWSCTIRKRAWAENRCRFIFLRGRRCKNKKKLFYSNRMSADVKFGVKRLFFTTASSRANFPMIMHTNGAVVLDTVSGIKMRVRASRSSRRVDFQETTQPADYEVDSANIDERFRTLRGPATFSSSGISGISGLSALSESAGNVSDEDTFDPRRRERRTGLSGREGPTAPTAPTALPGLAPGGVSQVIMESRDREDREDRENSDDSDAGDREDREDRENSDGGDRNEELEEAKSEDREDREDPAALGAAQEREGREGIEAPVAVICTERIKQMDECCAEGDTEVLWGSDSGTGSHEAREPHEPLPNPLSSSDSDESHSPEKKKEKEEADEEKESAAKGSLDSSESAGANGPSGPSGPNGPSASGLVGPDESDESNAPIGPDGPNWQRPHSPACVLESQACAEGSAPGAAAADAERVVVERLLQRLRVLMRAMCRREAYEALISALARCEYTGAEDRAPGPSTRLSRIEVLYGALYQLTSTSRGARIYRDELTRLRTQSAGAAPP